MAGSKEQRQTLRLALITGLVLDQIDDLCVKVEALSTAGAEEVTDFLKCIRENHKKDVSAPNSALFMVISKFLTCLSPEKDVRHAATFANEAGHTRATVARVQKCSIATKV